MKWVTVFLLAAVVAVSGCTADTVTDNDLDEQTRDINRHTEQVAAQNSKPVTKYEIIEVETSGSCTYEGRGDRLQDLSHAEVELFELSNTGIQSYDNSKLLIKNGIKEVDADIDCRNETHDESSATLETVTFNKSVYQNGSRIASGQNECKFYEDIRLDEDPWRIYDFAKAMAGKIYEDCFGVEYRGDIE